MSCVNFSLYQVHNHFKHILNAGSKLNINLIKYFKLKTSLCDSILDSLLVVYKVR